MYPATTKQAAGRINGVHTDVMTVAFADKILITIIQEGRLAQWIHVPLQPLTSGFVDLPLETDEDALLPLSHLTPTTVLGGTSPERETMGQLLTAQVASAIATKNPEETRTVVLGLGLRNLDQNQDVFYKLIDLVLECL